MGAPSAINRPNASGVNFCTSCSSSVDGARWPDHRQLVSSTEEEFRGAKPGTAHSAARDTDRLHQSLRVDDHPCAALLDCNTRQVPYECNERRYIL